METSTLNLICSAALEGKGEGGRGSKGGDGFLGSKLRLYSRLYIYLSHTKPAFIFNCHVWEHSEESHLTGLSANLSLLASLEPTLSVNMRPLQRHFVSLSVVSGQDSTQDRPVYRTGQSTGQDS